MKIQFLGAAKTVTGSKYLLKTHKDKYLVDCGLFQGQKNIRKRNWQALDVDPSSIKAVFLTHAHIDHSGYIPRLVATGFKGKIYCTKATFDLAKILLPDSGYLQEEEARFANKRGYSKHKPALPLYTREQAEESLAYFETVDFNQTLKMASDFKVRFLRAGHILGASSILVEGQGRRIIFSGDVGHYEDQIMPGPEPLPDADYLVLESTYGNRLHGDEDVFAIMAELINSTIKKKGVVLIPAFAVGRAQSILYIVNRLKEQKKIHNIKTYLDSPMAINATELYCQYHDEHKLDENEAHDMCQNAILSHTAEQSKAINADESPKIIISASGMASGGRVLHHLARYIVDEKNTILLVGFQAAGTRGRKLLEGATNIKIFGEEYLVKANIKYITSLSAHGDYKDLIRWLNESKIKNPKVFLTHGEEEAAKAMAEKISEVFKWRVEVPDFKDEFDL